MFNSRLQIELYRVQLLYPFAYLLFFFFFLIVCLFNCCIGSNLTVDGVFPPLI